jgi:hypothetical protein
MVQVAESLGRQGLSREFSSHQKTHDLSTNGKPTTERIRALSRAQPHVFD